MWEWIIGILASVSALSLVGGFVVTLRFRNSVATILGQLVVDEIHRQDDRIQLRLKRQEQQPSDKQPTPSRQLEEPSTIPLQELSKMRPGTSLASYLDGPRP